ncbi:inhibitor of nuclear factor kappa-B kinase-interacting protein isoform X2 [Brachyhypopomus gauderio]|uniref:inhibitor of nuclear factor kappa-B kinase-interacting protein isoform X2 n=1 Tax=Brachyhypopomus gauderio TaxID=698409 RepID=UPI004042669D
MPSNEVKHRKGKPGAPPKEDENTDTKRCFRDQVKKDGVNPSEQNSSGAGKSCVRSSSSLDLKTLVSFVSLSACLVLAWVAFQQHARFIEVEEKHRYLYEKAADLLDLEEKVSAVSKKCENVQVVLGNPEPRSSLSRLSGLEREVARLREWTSGAPERRRQQQEKLSELTRAVERIENRTTAISSDMAAKVAAVRTDVRRMAGLEDEVGGLLAQAAALEEKLAQAERLMVKRVAELLASSIDRVSGLKSSAEKNAQDLERLRRRLPELAAADKNLFERILAVESGRAKLVRTVTFASDLRPKVFTLKRDFGMLEPQLTDLTLRIGQLAEEVMKREEDIAQMKESLANFMALREELTVKPTSSDVLHQNDLSQTLTQTD